MNNIYSCLVIGARGMLGSTLTLKLKEAGYEVTEFTNKITGCQDAPDLTPYDVVFNCAGAIPQKRPTLNQMIVANIILPRLLSRTAKKLVHFSTDCVFSGLNNYDGYYGWADVDWATDDYGWTKRQGEILDSQRVLTIRTSIIGHRGAVGLLDWFLSGDHKKDGQGRAVVQGYAHHFWNGMTTNELSSVIIKDLPAIMTHHYGLWQLGGERLSKQEMLREIADVYKKDIIIETAAVPPGTCIINKCLATHRYNWQAKPFRQQLEEMRDDEIRWGI